MVGFFDNAYRDGGTPTWDVGRPQGAVVRLARTGLVTGSVIDAGCGTGENALHLAGLGHPVLGDRVYARYRDDMPPAPRVMLHARTLGFVHPTRDNGEVVHYEAAVPDDMMEVARRLGFAGHALPVL